jgi:hypothetical protein
MRIRLGAIVLLFILAAGTGHAQPKLLSLKHAIQAALENRPSRRMRGRRSSDRSCCRISTG